jgi:hypothetical protein
VKAFLGSMTGRVFITLLLGILLTAALTQLAGGRRAPARDRRVPRPAFARPRRTADHGDRDRAGVGAQAYLQVANRPGMRLEAVALRCRRSAPAPTEFTQSWRTRMNKAATRSAVAGRAPGRLRRGARAAAVFGLLRMKWRGTCESILVRLRDGTPLILSVLPPRSATSPERPTTAGTSRCSWSVSASWPTWWRA